MGTHVILASFFSGIAFATFAASGVFFLKFWKASRDGFFLYFSIACWLLAFERSASIIFEEFLKTAPSSSESGIWTYVIRLTAFIVIFVAILRKNQTNRSDTNQPTK